MANLESFRANSVNAMSTYVAISRAREGAAIYTDSRAKLTEAFGLRDGAQVVATDNALLRAPVPTDDPTSSFSARQELI